MPWARQLTAPFPDLLGGAVRERVAFSAYLFYKFATPDGWLETPAGTPQAWGDVGMYGWTPEVLTPEAMVEETAEFVRRYGFRSLKLKAGPLPPDEEVRTLRLIRERFGPDFPLRIDPNAGWSVETALRLLPQLEEIGLEYYEDPVRVHGRHGGSGPPHGDPHGDEYVPGRLQAVPRRRRQGCRAGGAG